jgi:hypothetical protein
MFSTLRTRFGIPGVISVIALVFALVGGAYAANNSSSGGKATASAKAKKGPRGPKGATGPAGPAGAQGPAGPAGAKGDAGANGSNGAAGPTGPTGAAGAKGATGAAGATGATGFSGFTATLPSGKTETGTWGEERGGILTSEIVEPISFSIPLAAGSEKAFFLSPEEIELEEGVGFEAGCTGSVEQPTAPAETLCVYTAEENNTKIVLPPFFVIKGGLGYLPAGTLMRFSTSLPSPAEPASISMNGTWAVTAP